MVACEFSRVQAWIVSPSHYFTLGEDYEDNHTMLETMARLLQPSLVQLVRLHCSKNNNKSTHDRALPHHCVLYGLHMSKLCLRIFLTSPWTHLEMTVHNGDSAKSSWQSIGVELRTSRIRIPSTLCGNHCTLKRTAFLGDGGQQWHYLSFAVGSES